MSAVPGAVPRRGAIIAALGVTQIFAWGSSYYLLAVLARPIAQETGWPMSWTVGGFSVGLLVAGLIAPGAGRAIEAYGGRPVLALGSLLLACGLLFLGLSESLPVYLLSWTVLGAGMACGLYDAAFSTLGRYFGREARSAITLLTLFGGFASTICWPISAFIVDRLGWREACFVYACVQIVISLPLHVFVLPGVEDRTPVSGQSKGALALEPHERTTFRLLSATMVLCGLVSSMISVHLLTMLQARGFDLAAAVAFGTLVGPSQVGARVVEMTVGKRHHAVWTMFAAVGLLTLGLVLLWSGLPITALALVFYGAGNGVFSIARGAVPLALFSERQYPAIMGRLALPSLITQATAPSLGGLILDRMGAGALLVLLSVSGAIAVGLVLVLLARVKVAGALVRP
ncbi:oxalate/formate antiporter family transporter [Hartmannibacter diazotrophicus]|uniref:Oxalate/formate antiporter family transporter n=1 Tax=Hartmannibacter diazotrophicus TaxID=1482074 RepID=A0A2C9D199_9HYPH|nr:MFS transporter [Hartmannibacter diazotrophicus]SON54092.1 oxalate/formate antiporter family transporter [Hartmannibacter diazotrophicus]